jgi:hypothetical protein
MLLSHAHHPSLHAATVPLAYTGTLTVDNAAAVMVDNGDGSTTTQTPVTGELGVLGAVHGVWTVSDDSTGSYLGPDTLQVHNASGAVVMAFDESSPGPIHRVKHGPASSEHGLQVVGGAGAYAHSTGSGAVTMTTNTARTLTATLTLGPGKS